MYALCNELPQKIPSSEKKTLTVSLFVSFALFTSHPSLQSLYTKNPAI